jgi:site-specific recombinase XerD
MGVYRRGNSWYYNFYYQHQRYQGCIGQVSKTVASEVLAKRRAEVIEGRYDITRSRSSPLFKDFAQEFLNTYASTKAQNTYKNYLSTLRNFNGAFGDKRLSDVTSWDIERYRSSRKQAGIKPNSINKELSCLKHVFNMAIEWKKLKESPFQSVKIPRDKNGRVRVLSLEEEAALFESIANSQAEHLEPITITGLHAGLRAQETINLRKEHINFKDGYLVVEYGKGGEGRIIPMSDQLTESLKHVSKDMEPGSYIFAKGNGKPLTYSGLRKAFDRVVRVAGITDFTFHDLRHSFASRLVMAGVDLVTVKELLGHKDIQMTMRYSHPVPAHKRAAVKILDRVTANLTTPSEKKVLSLPKTRIKDLPTGPLSRLHIPINPRQLRIFSVSFFCGLLFYSTSSLPQPIISSRRQ